MNSVKTTSTCLRFAALSLTHNCNLRCKYCYAGEKSKRTMSRETAFAAIDFLARHTDRRCVVTLFGGEPLMEFGLIREVVEYSSQNHGGSITFRMSTNGTLINDEVLRFCGQHGVMFSVSIDGHPKLHDRTRSFASGNGSYATIDKHLDRILKFNPYTVAISVVVPETAAMLAEGAQHLFGRGFRYVIQTLDYSGDWQAGDIATLKEQYSQLASFYYERLSKGSKIYYAAFDERIKTWSQKPYRLGDLCDMANSQIAIAPSGRIYPCVQFVADDRNHRFVIGDVRGGFDGVRRQELIAENMTERTACVGCDLHGRCATYCGCVNWQTTGHLDRIPPIICEHERMLMPIVDKMANRLWKKNVALFKRKFYDKLYPISSYLEDCEFCKRGHDAAD
jgi:uncharacterized protein